MRRAKRRRRRGRQSGRNPRRTDHQFRLRPIGLALRARRASFY